MAAVCLVPTVAPIYCMAVAATSVSTRRIRDPPPTRRLQTWLPGALPSHVTGECCTGGREYDSHRVRRVIASAVQNEARLRRRCRPVHAAHATVARIRKREQGERGRDPRKELYGRQEQRLSVVAVFSSLRMPKRMLPPTWQYSPAIVCRGTVAVLQT